MIGLLSLCLTACVGSPQPVLVKTTAVRLEPPELIPCERINADEADLRSNGDVWELKDQAIKLLDTCADQVDAQILRSQSK
ncbi:Rz1-like lysis system protein LysC [Pseudomonas amygdali]|uniref:Rz1-like lysis system protein LysC n=1 Tax=Pseudomonas amygdali TaxID=47877 RepID=UPI001F46C706|nr:Rz1-like lysis system protein LysC [Pseudomonas amygdali]